MPAVVKDLFSILAKPATEIKIYFGHFALSARVFECVRNGQILCRMSMLNGRIHFAMKR